MHPSSYDSEVPIHTSRLRLAFWLAALSIAPTIAAGQGPPTVTKSFSPVGIDPGATTALQFLLTNPAGSGAVSNVSFTDTLPAGLVVASPPTVRGTCLNAAAATIANGGTHVITVTALQVPAGPTTCTVVVDVTNAAGMLNPSCGALPAAFTNGATNVAATNAINAVTSNCITVGPPSVVTVPTLAPAVLGILALVLATLGFAILRR